MKITRILSLFLIVCVVLAACACSGKKEEEKPDPDRTPAEISEAAMNNFVKKLQDANYTVTGAAKSVTNVASADQVYFEYKNDYSPFSYVFMTVKDETFETMLYDDEDAVYDVVFIAPEKAVDTVGELLPNTWITITENNLFELFYNDPSAPLEFTSNDQRVKKTLLALGGYSEFALQAMEEVHMIFDAENPKTVQFKAVVHDIPAARIEYDDLHLTLTFGEGKSDPRVDKWIKDPVYPRIRTAWRRDDLDLLDLVFFRDYGKEAIPFPQTSSYAMIFDEKAYDEFLGMRLKDSHWTEKDVEDYKELLRNNGFTEITSEMPGCDQPVTVYRRLLRDEYNAYSQLYPHYDNGLVVEGVLYHESPEYEGQPAINEVIQKKGFIALPETDLFTGWKAADTSGSQSEAWAYFFDYDLYMAFTLEYKDFESAKAYLENYADTLLENGFFSRFTPGEDNRMCASANDYISFRYEFGDDEGEENTVKLEFKNQKSLTVEETLHLIREYGIPEPDIHGEIASKDVARYRYEISQFDGLFLMIYQPYESTSAAEHYLDGFVPMLEDLGYYQFNPEKLGSQRQFLYFNEEQRKYVAFDLLPAEDGATIFYEIVSFDPPSDSMMLNAIRF